MLTPDASICGGVSAASAVAMLNVAQTMRAPVLNRARMRTPSRHIFGPAAKQSIQAARLQISTARKVATKIVENCFVPHSRGRFRRRGGGGRRFNVN